MNQITRFITVANRGYITALHMEGPVPFPIQAPEKIVLDLVRRGYKVSEVNPTTKEKIELTIANFDKEDRFTLTSTETVAAVQEVKTAPVQDVVVDKAQVVETADTAEIPTEDVVPEEETATEEVVADVKVVNKTADIDAAANVTNSQSKKNNSRR